MITDETIFALWDSPVKEDLLIGVELALNYRDWEWFKNIHKTNPESPLLKNIPTFAYNKNLGECPQSYPKSNDTTEIKFGLLRMYFNKIKK